MDIHRARFVPYPPSAINAVAFTYPSGTAAESQPIRLAIGRANGDIEIWNPLRGIWTHEITCRGGKDRSIEGLAWIQDPDETDDESGFVTRGRLRLFSIGYSSVVTEWDLLTGLPRRQSTGNHSDIWCLAAQPKALRRTNPAASAAVSPDALSTSQDLVIGCADGTLILLSTANDDITFSRFIVRTPRKNARALSLAFQNRHRIVAGYADSSIRVYDVRNGTLIRNMSLGAGPHGGPKDILAWSVLALRNGNIVSGDSTGQVVFWDGNTYGQLQRIQGHEADTLCLAASVDGETVMSGGMDRRTAVYRLERTEKGRRRWAKTAHRRLHQHDVKAMASFESSKMSIVASGGLDTTPLLTPLRGFGSEYHRKLPLVPQQPPVVSAPLARLVVSWWDRCIEIWQMAPRKSSIDESQDLPHTALHQERKYRTVATLNLKGDESISSASITADGSLLAVATSAELRLFQLAFSARQSQPSKLKVNKLEIPSNIAKPGARLVTLSDNGQWLLRVGLDNAMSVSPITRSEDGMITAGVTVKLRRRKQKAATQNGLNGFWGDYDRTIVRTAFAPNAAYLAVADLGGHLDTWMLHHGEIDATAPPDSSMESGSSDEDSGSEFDAPSVQTSPQGAQRWTRTPQSHLLPRFSAAPLILSFRPAVAAALDSSTNPPTSPVDDRLLLVTATHEILELSVRDSRLTEWSRRNPASHIPPQLTLQRDRAMGFIWDFDPVAQRERVWLYGAAWLCMIDLSRDFEGPSTTSKRKLGNEIAPLTHGHGSVAKQLRYAAGSQGAGSRTREDEMAGLTGRVANGGTDNALSSGPSALPDADEGVEDVNDDVLDIRAHAASNGTDLASLRRTTEKDRDEDANDTDEDAEPGANGTVVRTNGDTTSPSFYLTTRYRSILGIVPLAATPFSHDENEAVQVSVEDQGGLDDKEDEDMPDAPAQSPQTTSTALTITKLDTPNGTTPAHTDLHQALEVLILERPPWDLDLAPRFYGAQEWEH